MRLFCSWPRPCPSVLIRLRLQSFLDPQSFLRPSIEPSSSLRPMAIQLDFVLGPLFDAEFPLPQRAIRPGLDPRTFSNRQLLLQPRAVPALFPESCPPRI